MGGSGPGTAKLCDTCKSLSASLFCRADSAFLCLSCDSRVHAANKLASRHARVWVCEVCEHLPASVTCKADAAHLCVTCDRDIHSANPLARRHERVPITPFFEVNQSEAPETGDTGGAALIKSNTNAAIDKLFGEDYYPDVDEEEAQAASWLLTNPSVNPEAKGSGKLVESGDPKSIDYLFADDDVDPYLDLDFSADPKADLNASADCVVPDQKANRHIQNQPSQLSFYSLASYNSQFDDAYENASKPFSLPYSSRQAAVSQSVSSSSMDVGVVPDASAVADVSKGSIGAVAAVSGLDREARVLRYREKRKNRKFEKTIRYASRKAYAETRPRIKGRFAKRTDMDVGRGAAAAAASEGVVAGVFGSRQDLQYDAVPSF